ncbi:beta-microseminoprotein A1-like [Ascaphus truei]|uniref:beta-microseminoprotein A1-like n=1 Tax=Ascaphus truei TaxID=8439 RepID=UPI003F5A56E5
MSYRSHLVLATLALVFYFLVTLCNTSCYNAEMRRMRPGSGYEGCVDTDGEMHAFNSTWKSDACMDCECDKSGISCCSNSSMPYLAEPDACEAVFNTTSCSYQVKRKDNTSEACNSLAMM